MAFQWTNDISEGNSIDSEDIVEVTDILKSIENIVVSSKPYLPIGTPNCTNNDPLTGLLWHDIYDNEIIQEDAYDQIALNMDYIRENNWCRGHRVALYSNENDNEKVTEHTDKYVTEHIDRYVNENGTNNADHNTTHEITVT